MDNLTQDSNQNPSAQRVHRLARFLLPCLAAACALLLFLAILPTYAECPTWLNTIAGWISADSDSTVSVAWGDVDGDGDLDLAAGNYSGPNKVYLNQGGSLQATASWTSADSDYTYSVAWGDMDGDGDLDLAAGNYNGPNKVYINQGGRLEAAASWTSADSDYTYSVAWGDVDGNGDLDLATGNWGGSNKVYLNWGGSLQATASWTSADSDSTVSVAWADVDGDGDLDLAAGNWGDPIKVYLNQGGSLQATASWTSPDSDYVDYIYGVAWGDVDGDGDLDLAAGNYNGPNKVYINQGDADNNGQWDGALTLSWISTDSDSTVSVAWGDVDGDGDLDLAAGNWDGSNKVYLNWEGRLEATTSWTSADSDYTYSVAWADMDGDGDLDLVAGNYNGPNKVYLYKEHQVRVVSGTTPIQGAVIYRLPANQSRAFSIGETNVDGYLPEACEVQKQDQLFAAGPSSVGWAADGTLAFDGLDDYVKLPPMDPNYAGGFTVEAWVRFDTFRSGSGIIDFGKGTWADNIVFGNNAATQNLSFRVYSGTLREISALGALERGTWMHLAATVDTDGAARLYVNGEERATVNDFGAIPSIPRDTNYIGRRHNFWWYDYFDGAMDEVRIWNVARSQAEIRDNMDRQLSGSEAGLVAYWPFDEGSGDVVNDKTGNHAPGQRSGPYWGDLRGGPYWGDLLYTLYHTSGSPNNDGVNMYGVEGGGVHTLTASPAHPLILFDLDVSLEWDARGDPGYLDQLEADLKQASRYLYDFTDGQMALGEVTVYQNRDHWLDSDIVVYANNRLRPYATIGGAVGMPTPDIDNKDITYYPGRIALGSTWSRYGEPLDRPGKDWPLVLAHELGHYLLYLDETYLGFDDEHLLTAIDTLTECTGTAMGAVYVPLNTEFISDKVRWEHWCTRTLAYQRLGRTEWQSITGWYPDLISPNSDPNHPALGGPDPDTMPLELTSVDIRPPATPRDVLDAPTFYVRYNGYEDLLSSPEARAYLLRNDRIIALGGPTGGQNRLLARGAQTGDQLCVFDPAQKQAGCWDVNSDTVQTLKPINTPVISLSPVTSVTYQIEITGLASTRLSARLYPEYGTSSAEVNFSAPGTATITLSSPAWAGHVVVSGVEPLAIVPYGVSGNPGPSQSVGGPSQSVGGPSQSVGAPIISSDGLMVFYTPENEKLEEGQFYLVHSLAGLPASALLPAEKKQIGPAYSVRGSETMTQPITGSVSFQYRETDVLIEQVKEERLAIHHWDGHEWQTLDTRVDPYYNLASAPSQGPGVYALLGGVTGPSVTDFTPSVATNDVTTTLTITGTNFLGPVDVVFTGLLTATDMFTFEAESVSSDVVTAKIPPDLPAQEYEMVVVNGDGGQAVVSGTLSMFEPLGEGVCFYDGFGSGPNQWALEGDWDIVILPSGQRAITDSPSGPYRNAGDYGSGIITYTTAITSPPFSLAECITPVLSLSHAYVIAQDDQEPPQHQDLARVEISTNDGATWMPLASYSGGGIFPEMQAIPSPEWADVHWKQETMRLDAYTGTVRLRFSLQVDQNVADRGWVIDEVTVKSGGPPPGGSAIYLPMIMKRAGPAGPDLVGSFSLSPDKQNYSAGEPVQIDVVVTNQGTITASPFWVDFYINPTSPPMQANVPWNSVCGLTPCLGLAWYVEEPLPPGQSVHLTSESDTYVPENTFWPGYFANGTSDLYLYVDSWKPGTGLGAVVESNETNNRAERHGLVVTGPNPAALDASPPPDLPPRPAE